MNQQGHSWPEAILTLSVLIIIFGTLLPFATKMTSQLHSKKLDMHAAETAYYGAIVYEYYELTGGTREIDGNFYTWSTNLNLICVSYKKDSEVKNTCIDY